MCGLRRVVGGAAGVQQVSCPSVSLVLRWVYVIAGSLGVFRGGHGLVFRESSGYVFFLGWAGGGRATASGLAVFIDEWRIAYGGVAGWGLVPA